MKDEEKTKEQLINELTQAKTALHKIQIHFAAILEIANEAIIAIDETQHITLFNKGAETIFGYSMYEIMGQPLDILIPEQFMTSHRGHVVDFDKSTETTRFLGERREISGRRKSGEEFPAEASISKFEIDGRRIFTVVLRDITARKKVEQEREELIKELDVFAYTVGHNLKNPLNLITGYSDLLIEQARLPDELHEYLNSIARNGRKMINIVEELQVLAGVRKAEVALKPLHMARIVARAQQRLTYMSERYKAQIIVAENWPTALGHAPWVEEVWVNYLSNAIKFGGQPPCLRLGATTRSDGTVRFWVHDNGPGIPLEDQKRLFTPFTQLNQARIEGHGLGLSIVQHIITRLGGQVGVKSDGIPGQGCVFSFTLNQA